MRFGLKLVTTLALGLVGFASSEESAESTPVTVLSKNDFNDFINANPVTLVKFMAPWCGHCKKLAPEYEAAAIELKKNGGIPLAEVDATNDGELARQFNVQGFPTMILFRDGKPEPYSGGRTKSAIIDWIKKMTGVSIQWVDSKADVEKAIGENPVAFVAAVPSKDDKAAELFESVANSNRMKGTFIAYVDSSVNEATIGAYRKSEDVVSDKIEDKATLQAFVEAESVPYLGPVGGENYAQYAARSNNWAWFAANKEDYEKYGNALRKVSKNYRSEFNFVWLDIDSLKHHAEAALGLKNFPSVALVWEEGKYHFTDEITEKEFTKFVEAVKAGKIKRFLKSEPVPEKNDEPVKVIVGSQFSEMVLQKDKDVFLKVYAPWCGHCKKLAPIWDELAEKTKNSKNFLVAKFDGTENEPDVSGFDFHGFPTLYFIKAGNKTPIPFEGERTVEGMLEFARKNAQYPIVAEGVEESKDEL